MINYYITLKFILLDKITPTVNRIVFSFELDDSSQFKDYIKNNISSICLQINHFIKVYDMFFLSRIFIQRKVRLFSKRELKTLTKEFNKIYEQYKDLV